MEDEDGTCLLDVLCDPQALNDFLHGTNELPSEDLLISSGPGEPSLFADTPSPVSLLADDAGSQGTPASGCVDLSFLEEALLASPEAEGDPEEVQASTDIQPEGQHEPEEDEEKEEEEACDILQQSLQEADITEHTLALEAGLEQPGEDSPLYPPGTVLPTPSTSYLSRPLTAPGVPTLPRDTQGAVDPPQPSLLAVGPGCPSLKPTAPQLMGLLPGNVFPTPPPDASFSLSPVQGSSMLIPKALPSLTSRQVLAPAVRATAAPGILLQRAPLPIQPKLPVSIQPRLVQISPKPPGQKGAQGFTFVPGTTSQNILLSPPVGPKHTSPPQPVASLSKPVSLQLVSQGGSIVIQPQGLFRGQSPFLLPGQPSVSLAQTRSVAQPLLNPASSQIPSMPSGGPPASGHLVDGSQILTVPPRQLSFSPVFTTPTGQLALRQGALLSGPVQLQSAPPTVFQMPAQLAGAYAPQAQGQPGPVVHSPALGNHITLINSSGVITPDLASISIVNGPSVVQGVPFASQAQKALVAGMPEGQLSLPPTSVLLLPDRPATEERAAEEQLQNTLQQSRQLSSHTPLQSSAGGLPPQPASAVTLLQALPDANHPPEPVTSLSKHLLPQQEIQQAVKMGHVPPPQQQVFIPGLDIQQPALQPLAPSESLTGTLPVQVHTVANGEDSSPTPLPVIGQGEESGELPTLLHLNRMPTPLHSGMDQKDVMSSPLIGQIYEGGLPTSLLSHEGCGGQALAPLALSEGGQLQSGHEVCGTLSPGAVSVCAPQQQPVFGSEVSGLDGESEPATEHVQQSYPEAPCVVGDDKLGSVAPQDPQAPGSPAQRPLTGLGGKIQPALVTRALVLPSAGNYTEEPLTPAMRRHRFQQQLCLDHGRVLNPNTRSPFSCLEDVVRHLLPYHTCASSFPSPRELSAVDRQFASVSGLLLRGTTDMLNKYRQLLLAEAKQESPSAEMVMLERLFLQSERFTLADERRRARRDPESFLASLRKSDTATGGTGSPSPPPAWTLHSDRPPGLKTYRSSSKGALRLTIKQELGARTIVHNSACDTALSGHKQNYNKQLANGGDVQVREVSDGPRSSPEPRLQQNSSRAQPGECPLLPNKGSWRTGIHSRPLTEALANPECHERGRTLLDLDTPLAKRHKPEAVEAQRPGLPSATLMEDSVLSNHLQSAIDSILELQRLQGPVVPVPVPVPTSRQSHALEKAVSSMLRGQLCPK